MDTNQLTWAVTSIAWWTSLAFFLEYFWISWEALLILSILLALDYIFGVADAYITNKQSVTSKKMWQWLAKKLTRRCLPLIVILILKWLWTWELEMATTVIFSILIITEWYSIIWHIYSINTWKQLPEIDALEMLIDFIIKLIKGKLPNVNDKDSGE